MTAGLAVLATTTLSAFAGAVGAGQGSISSPKSLAVTVGAVVVDALILAAVFRIATATRLTFNGCYPAPSSCRSSGNFCRSSGRPTSRVWSGTPSVAYGTFVIVLGLLAWIFFAALGVVVGVEINVVRAKRLYPRALLTPFTETST